MPESRAAMPESVSPVFSFGEVHQTLGFSSIRTRLVPPPRFETATLDNYLPDAAYPSQAAAKTALHVFCKNFNRTLGASKFIKFFTSFRPLGAIGIYLDGGFGVGKTHLLAATYHATRVPEKCYLSFTELVYLIGLLGLEKCAAEMRTNQLICIDEFELDDPGNTMMALGFLSRMVAAGVRLVATSNTPPARLGEGRFNAADFQREIGDIASAFSVLRVDGTDYREKKTVALSDASTWKLENLTELYTAFTPQPNRKKLLLSQAELNAALLRFHPMHYAGIAERLDAVFISEFAVLENQFDALRFVYFIDKLYDNQVKIFASATVSLKAIFPDEFYKSAYVKKYQRCLSRLSEICRTS